MVHARCCGFCLFAPCLIALNPLLWFLFIRTMFDRLKHFVTHCAMMKNWLEKSVPWCHFVWIAQCVDVAQHHNYITHNHHTYINIDHNVVCLWRSHTVWTPGIQRHTLCDAPKTVIFILCCAARLVRSHYVWTSLVVCDCRTKWILVDFAGCGPLH